MNAEGYDLLDRFGKIVAKGVDATLKEVKLGVERVRAPSHPNDFALRQYLESSSEDQRALKIARYAVQKFMHGLIADLDDSTTFQLTGKSSTGELLDLKRYSDLFAAETGVWFRKYSEHGSAADDLLDISRTLG